MSGNYDIGYGKPPRESRFQPGQSGNPKGRPKRQRINIAEQLTEPISFSVNGKDECKPPFEAGLLSMVAKAIKGDMSAARTFLGFCNSAGMFERPEPIDDHQYVLRIPKDWDKNEWMAMYNEFGPPPWKGERDGSPKNPPWVPVVAGELPDDEKDESERLDDRDYEVGYGRPPLQTQFRRGRSGNPRGRPKGSQSHSTTVWRVALRRLAMGGRVAHKRAIDLVIEAVRRAAAKGDFVALSLVKKYTGYVDDEEPPIAKGVLIVGERLTQEEWEEKYAHLGE